MTERKLATIRRVKAIDSIPGADMIECVTVDGWTVVSQKGRLAVGDLCVYFEIDSVLPVDERFEFLRRSSYVKRDWLQNGEGFRLKTIRLRKQLSQGLILTIEEIDYPHELSTPFEGEDVTEMLGVQLYEIPDTWRQQHPGTSISNFPHWIRKTHQERIQNIYHQWTSKYWDQPFEASLKLDGSSMTIYLKDGVLGCTSKNVDLDMSWDHPMVRLANMYEPHICTLAAFSGRDIALQGECMGPGMPMGPGTNRERLKETRFYLFNIWDITNQEYWSPALRQDAVDALKLRGMVIPECPIIDQEFFPFSDKTDMVETLDWVNNQHSIGHEYCEGVVFKSLLYPEVQFKAISNKYLENERS